MKKRCLALFMSLVIVFSFAAPAYAETNAIDGNTTPTSEDAGAAESQGHTHIDTCYEEELVCTLPAEAHVHDESECYGDVTTYICGIDSGEGAHSHSDSCYAEAVLTCTQEEIAGHSHGDGCYETASEPSCGQNSGDGAHTHGGSCYTEKLELSCSNEEDGHEHSSDCYTTTSELSCGQKESSGHEHGSGCYERVQTCTQDEIEGHTHGIGCYAAPELVCDLEETDGHIHTSDCEQTSHQLICELSTEPHVHGAECYQKTLICELGTPAEEAPPVEADPVCPGDDTCTIEGCQNHNPPAPVLSCDICGAEGHTEEECTVECSVCGEKHLDEDCAFYDPVTAEVYTETDGVYTLIDGHSEDAPIDVEDYDGKTVYILASGEAQNLFFYRSAVLGFVGAHFTFDGNDYAMMTSEDGLLGTHGAIVTVSNEVEAGETFVLHAGKLLGGEYTVTIQVVDEIPKDIYEVETIVDGTMISVSGEDIPADVALTACAVAEEQYHESLGNYIEDKNDLLAVFDITLADANGIWQPESGSVTVTLDVSEWGVEDGNKIVILHDHDDALGSLGKYTVKDGTITFETDGFSVFYFYLIFEFDGYEYILSGGSEVYLSDLLQALGINKDVSDVESVEFSDPSLVEIEYVGGDWLITSLEEFGSEDYLTIIFDDGTTIEICVTDPVIYNYAVDNSITNVTKLDTTPNYSFGTRTDGDATATGKTFTVNKDSITVEQVKTAGTTDATVTTPHMVIYVTEGMAVRFIGGTNWPSDTSRPTYASDSIWYWSWNSTDNYAIIKDGTVGESATFQITVTVSGTAYYCNVTLLVVEDSKPTLLEDELPAGYSIKNVPVTLYNYDGKAFNEYYDSKGGNYLAFSGTSGGISSTENAGNRGWTSGGEQANGGGGVALMGIMKNELVNGLPVTSQGQGVDLFSSDTLGGAKDVYENVGFQFIYNNETGYYSYNSALNHAQYNSRTNEIELYKQSLAPSDTPIGASHGNAGFYPFEDINYAFTNTGYTSMRTSDWKEKLEDDAFELIPSQYSTDIALTSATNSTADMHYGLQVKSAFYLPEGKKLNGQEMIYEFTGDDDLWVYIDGQLVLDIGGGHTYVSGSFNLTTGGVWVEKYTQLTAADGGSYSNRVQGTDLRYTDSFLTSLEDDQMHTIQIFYLERHGGVSNCRMHFNLPLAPMNAVEVSKTLVNQNGEPLSVTPDVEYTFQIFTAEDDDDIVDATNFVPLANKSFFGGKKTDERGLFTLKAGETARFEGIPRFAEVYVVEIEPNDGYVYTDSKVSVNGATAIKYVFGDSTATKIVQSNEAMSFDFTNYMQTQPLTIKKQVVNGTAGLIDPNQKFAFTLDFTKPILETGQDAIQGTNQAGTDISMTDGGTFDLGHDESITIPRVPVNMTFTLMESNPDMKNGSFDAPKFESNICTTTETPNAFGEEYSWTMGNGGANIIEVTNQQRFNLTITKSGIQGVDHDNDEQQSTIYTIVGKIGTAELVKMDVVICGNASATICKLPVGSYTVTEKTDWAWRYEPKKGAVVIDLTSVARDQEGNVLVSFANTREKTKWLSGDCYVENWFTTDSIKKRDGSDKVIE